MNQHNPNRSNHLKDALLSNIKREPDNHQLQGDNLSLSFMNTINQDVSTPPIRPIPLSANNAALSSYTPLFQHPPEMSSRCRFPISSPIQAPGPAKELNPVNHRSYASGNCSPPPLPPSYTSNFGRFLSLYDYPPRSPSVGYRTFDPCYNTDSALNPQLMRMPPPASVSAAINSPPVSTIAMSAMASSNVPRSSGTYSVPPTTTSTASSRQSVLMPRQQQSTLLPPLSHSTGMNQSSPIFNSSSILKRLKAKAQSEMSSVLRLDPAVLLNRSPQVVSQEPAKQSRKGFHVCYYCQRIFSSPSLYANHLNRPVARVLYRCHLCPSTSDAVVPVLLRSSSTEQSGNLSAPNLCALYAHMAQFHALETPFAWKLIPSRLSVTAIPWLTGNLEGSLKQQPSQSAFPQTIYSEGQELVDVDNDIDRRLTNMLRVSEFRFQPPDSGDGEDTFLLSPDVRFTSVFANHFISTPFNLPESSGLSNDGLPTSLNSPISHLLFRLAEASSWHGHFFLAGWYPSLDSSGTQEATLSPPSPASFEEIQKAYEALLKDSQHPFCLSSTVENGTLRCMLCGTFRTDSCNSLRNHLTGCSNMVDMATAKCALCSLPLVHNRRDTLLCSIRAHLLFHLDIYLFCPHCGFAPPPDLPPQLAEVCLRLHLRFVCFHFNLVRVLLCSKPAAACRERIFLSVESFVHHWFEAHTARKYGCPLCGTPQAKLEEGVNGSANRLNCTLQFPDLATACTHIQESHSLPSASANTFPKVTYECSECPFMSSIPVEFVDHFSLAHCRPVECDILSTNSVSSQNRQSPCESRCYYRCFGLCRQIFPSLEELRSHMKTCVYALATLKQALGDLLFNSSVPVKPTQGQSSDIANNGKNPLCLCLYCDISAKNYNVSLGKKNDSETLSSTGSPNFIPTSPSTFQPAEPFEDLKNLHDHEYTTHVIGSSLISGGNQVGCPFCREKLTLKASDSGSIASELLNHLRRHAMANPYVSWQMNRMRLSSEIRAGKFHFRNFNCSLGTLTVSLTRIVTTTKVIKVVTCHCSTGLLDSPLALMAHAAALPTSANIFRGSSRSHKFGDVALLPLPSLFPSHLKKNSTIPVTGPTSMEVQLASTSTATQTAINVNEASMTNGGVIETRERNVVGIATVKFLYQPGGHPPLSKEVYEHLRFGHYFELDDRLKTFNGVLDSNFGPSSAANRVFVCPICQYHGASRWALTEHAFFFHWLRLCYICCDYIYDDSASGDGSNKKSIWSHIYTCLNHRHAAILSFKSDPGESFEEMDIQIHQPGKKRRHSALETEESVTESSELLIPPSILHPSSSHTVEDRSGDLDESQVRDPSSSFPMQPTDAEEDDVPLAIRAQTDGLSDNAVSSKNPR